MEGCLGLISEEPSPRISKAALTIGPVDVKVALSKP